MSRLLLPARLLVFHRPKIFFRAGVGVAWIFLLTAAAPGLAASDEAQGPALDQAISPSLVTSIQQYWDLTPEQKSRPMALRLECDVTYFDAGWKMLFIQDVNGRAAYAPYGDNAFEFKAGQHILATGVILPPNADVSFEHATITLKGPAQTVPLPIDGKVTQFWHFTSRFVSLEGLVDHIERIDPSHMRLSLSVEGEAVFALVLFDAGDDVPNLKDTIMRIEGVYNAKIGPDNKFASLEILVPGLNHLNIVNRLEDDPRFLTPVVPIETLPRLPGDRLAHIAGRVKAQEQGRLVRIRDTSGQIDVQTGQVTLCPIDAEVDAVGFPVILGTQWRLRNGLFRVDNNGAAGPAGQPVGPRIRLAQQVMELPVSDAIKGLPVWLAGVVTWSDPNSPFFFIQDSSGGICIMRGGLSTKICRVGENVEVHGMTSMGSFAPAVTASEFAKLSDLFLPQAKQVSLDQALTGVEEATWVEMTGYLRQIRRGESWNNLEIGTSTGDFSAMLPASEDVSSMVGAVVRLQGVCTADANSRRRLTGITLYVPGAAFVQIGEPRPDNPFDLPARPIGSLGQFDTLLSVNRRIRVSGVVLHHSPGHLIHIADAGQTLLVLSRDKAPLEPGDRIDAVGFPGRQGGRLVLRESVYRKTGYDPQPTAVSLQPQSNPVPDLDGQLVNIAGTLIDTSPLGDQSRLSLQSNSLIFEAFLENVGDRPRRSLPEAGSLLSLTGVYELKFDEYGQPAGFQLRLRTPADIAVLQHPTWLTRGRVLAVSAVLVVGILLFIAWVAALRRRVRAQTEQIRDQLRRESRLEAELVRSSRLESLGLLAGGIAHDFNNLLTVVMGNISLARLDEKMDAESASSLSDAEKAVVRARDLTQQLLTFAKGGAPVRTAVNLPDLVREVATFAVRGSQSRCQFDLPDDLWPANVDKSQIGQVVQNIVINATQAMPDGGTVDIALRNERVGAELGQMLAPGRYVKLTIADHGPGISAEDLQRIFDPYFTTKKQGSGLGLATVHSIIKKHLGHISVESVVGKGTIFRIWLPAAEYSPDSEAAPSMAAAPPAAPGKMRILFMDDEDMILRVASALLRRIGYDVTTVAHGEAAVQAYARAQQERRAFDLVILDLTVAGGMGGRQAMEELLKLDPSVRAIVSSGYSNDLVLSNYHAHGFRGMVSKPYDIVNLAQTIEEVLKG